MPQFSCVPRRLRALVLICVGFWASVVSSAHGEPPTQPRVVAHRGLLRHAPENTLANFRACLQLRVGFEFDVRRSRDGVLVCVHDDTLNRTTNGTGRVVEATLETLQSLDAGSWFDPAYRGERIPTIEQVLSLVADSRQTEVLIAADLKADDPLVERDLVRLVQRFGIHGRVLVIGRAIDHPDVRRRLLAVEPRIQVAVLAQTRDDLSTALADPDSDWVYLRFVPTSDDVQAAQRAGKRVFLSGPLFAGHAPEHWKQGIETRAHGLLTDYPLEFEQLRRAISVPPAR